MERVSCTCNLESVEKELLTTVYSDRLSLNYPPISDVFDNIEYFSALNKWFNFDIIEK